MANGLGKMYCLSYWEIAGKNEIQKQEFFKTKEKAEQRVNKELKSYYYEPKN